MVETEGCRIGGWLGVYCSGLSSKEVFGLFWWCEEWLVRWCGKVVIGGIC